MKDPTPSGADGPGTGWLRALPRGGLARVRTALLEWYRPRSRPLRIRSTNDAWAVLVAEVMAQQTQITRVDEAWVRFMARYPTPGALAAASTTEVLRSWAGLGYNRRAIALRRAANLIVEIHAGRVPDDLDELEALPGVGPYTARAVASVAYGRAVAAVDTNVRRVLERLVGSSLRPRELQLVADQLVPPDQPATWTHATMDLGATVCRPRRPRCDRCPLQRWCASAGTAGGDRHAAGRSGDLAGAPFESTSRWLRGRIVDRLLAVDEGAWSRLPDAMGEHGPERMAAAVAALERDGLLELRDDGAVRLPSGGR